MRQLFSTLMLFFMLAVSSQLAAERAWNVKVAPSRQILDWGDSFTLHIEIDHPENYAPSLFEFLQKEKKIEEVGFFRLLHAAYEEKTGRLELDLTYEPLREGKLVCTPGPLSFYSQEGAVHQVLFRSVEASLVPSEKGVELAPLVDESPEGKISLSQKNRETTFYSQEILQKEAKYNQKKLASHSFAWTMFTLVISVVAALFFIFWGIREPFLRPKKKKKTFVKRNWKVEYSHIMQEKILAKEKATRLVELIRDKLSSLEKRPLQGTTVSELVQIVAVSMQLSTDEKMVLQKTLIELEKAQFSPNSLQNDSAFERDENLIQFFGR